MSPVMQEAETGSEDRTLQRLPMQDRIRISSKVRASVKMKVLLYLLLCSLNEVSGCGTRVFPASNETRIIGGVPTSLGEWPWQVSLNLRNPSTGVLLGHQCGGVVISSKWVLTAAHCMLHPTARYAIPPQFWLVCPDSLTSSPNGSTALCVRVRKILIHQRFDRRRFTHDLALLSLTERMKVSGADATKDYSGQICLPDPKKHNFKDRECVTTGWGVTTKSDMRSRSNVLMKTSMPVLSWLNCSDAYPSFKSLKRWLICAGYWKGGKGPCLGDSGGPLQCLLSDGRWYLAGVVSWGVGCAESAKPAMFVRVTSYLDWIRSNTKETPTRARPSTSIYKLYLHR
ncbi:plasma kallikrein-like [Ornithodoros turicata]|uniref:plasma kallikrein-like n=1 Tax=Ornithodoros turicata TaxID=34597 RepID=UPI003138A1F8